MFSPCLDWVNNNYFIKPGAGRLDSMRPSFMTPGILAINPAICGLILRLDALVHPHSAEFAELPAMVEGFT